MAHKHNALCAVALIAAGCEKTRELTQNEWALLQEAADEYKRYLPLNVDLLERMDDAARHAKRKDMPDRSEFIQEMRASSERLEDIMRDGRVNVIIDEFDTHSQHAELGVTGHNNLAKSDARAAVSWGSDRGESNDELYLRAYEGEDILVIDKGILLHELGHLVARQGHKDKWGYAEMMESRDANSLFAQALRDGDIAFTLTFIDSLTSQIGNAMHSSFWRLYPWVMSSETIPDDQLYGFVNGNPLDILQQRRAEIFEGAMRSFSDDEDFRIAEQYGLTQGELQEIISKHFDELFADELVDSIELNQEFALELRGIEGQEAQQEVHMKPGLGPRR